MKSVDLFGYKVYENGDIIGLRGSKINKNRPQIKVYWGKNRKQKEVGYARFVYYAFNFKTFNFHDKSIIIDYKDGNKNNYNINNLVAIKRGKIYQGENNSQSKLTNKQVEEIRYIYNKKKNFDLDKNYPFTKISYRKLAEKYGVSHSLIKGIVKGTYRNKERYITK